MMLNQASKHKGIQEREDYGLGLGDIPDKSLNPDKCIPM